MIAPGWCRVMAAYNAEMNRRLMLAASRLDEEARRAPRGAYWGSLHGTLSHLAWGDAVWLSRLDGGEAPATALRDSASHVPEFETLARLRAALDRRIARWARGVTPGWLAEPLTWHSRAAGATVSRPGWLVATHLFNHQTHHRGQAHALLTAQGRDPGDTDLFLVLPERLVATLSRP